MASALRRVLTVLLSALVVLGLSFSGLTTPAAHAADTGVITGVVRAKPVGGTSAVMPDATVLVYQMQDDGFSEYTASDYTDAQGRYAVTGLPAGDYEVRIIPSGGSSSAYVEEYYDNGWGPSAADLVTVGTGTVTLGDVLLEPGGWVTGHVTDTTGKPLPNTWVYVGLKYGTSVGVRTDAAGYYDSRNDTWGRLVPGGYFVSSSGPDSYDSEAPVYRYVEKAVNIVAGGGSVVDLVAEQLKTVVFTVRDAAGTPVTWAPVELRIQQEPGGPFDLPQYGPIETDDEGKFRVVSRANAYKLRFHPDPDSSGDDVPEWWDGGQGAASYDAAAAVTWTSTSPMKTNRTVTLGALTGPVPTISGTPRVGQTLTASAGTWSPAGPALAYQWLAGGQPIAGATSSTLALTAAQAGKAISVKVTGKVETTEWINGEETIRAWTATTTSLETAAVADRLVAGRPTISGLARVGQTLTANGAWAPGSAALSYRWLANGQPIAGATQRTFTLTAAQVGKAISVTVTGSHAGQQASDTSAATSPVVGVLTRAVPTIKGKAVVGKKLKAKPGAWGPAPVQVTYTWLRNGKVIKGATAATYKLKKKDARKRIQVRVTVSKPHYLPFVAVSKKTAKVKR